MGTSCGVLPSSPRRSLRGYRRKVPFHRSRFRHQGLRRHVFIGKPHGGRDHLVETEVPLRQKGKMTKVAIVAQILGYPRDGFEVKNSLSKGRSLGCLGILRCVAAQPKLNAKRRRCAPFLYRAKAGCSAVIIRSPCWGTGSFSGHRIMTGDLEAGSAHSAPQSCTLQPGWDS